MKFIWNILVYLINGQIYFKKKRTFKVLILH